jgi:hypothetical protein
VESIGKTWPGIGRLDVRRISANDCNSWAAGYRNQYSAIFEVTREVAAALKRKRWRIFVESLGLLWAYSD